ncbi:ABC transporter ATP-binding protein [Chelativorans sp. M5D2P16]|uniref:ABC transporter ATP-binding protein n=1 Tax=Chelativorans sp. M5D2P16 TaxID=3095678 RepID=UPI002ACA9EC6|nr:ABC transporter ATP-binding protein [Chelativorans sp. M5D2P16]MDZ5696595.1 ABC transporter ATP-binding protein [Chelativorans sp. M5D2P16]
MNGPLLEIRGISKRFGGLQALEDLSFDVSKGEIVGLIGPNGAGKSTLFNTLVGLHKPTAGAVRLEGKDVTGLRPHRIAKRGMTKTFQNVALFAETSVLDNVLIGALLRESVADARATARTCLERVGLADVAEKAASDLSFPERARVEVARGLATRPKVLLLDEVMAALNRVEMEEIMVLIRSLREDGLTVIVVEHHMHAIMSLCERIVVLNFGRKIAEGSPQEISRNQEVVRAYLGREYA